MSVTDKSIDSSKTLTEPFIVITEQPQSTTTFQPVSKPQKGETIKGVNSTLDEETYPSIELVNYKGAAVVVVSCVTKDPPYLPHPCNIVDKTRNDDDGVYHLRFCADYPFLLFPDMVITRVEKKDVVKSLEKRKEVQVDPFRSGFRHRNFSHKIDLNCVRLCFQTFLQDPQDESYKIALEPVVSDPIYNNDISILKIYYISHASASAAGGQTMCILSPKLVNGDVAVRFFDSNGWSIEAKTVSPHFHKCVAVIFESPEYINRDIDVPVSAFVQLVRRSDGRTSEPVPFVFVPWENRDQDFFKRKRWKSHETPRSLVWRHLQAESVTGGQRHIEQQKNRELQLHNIQRQQYQDSPYKNDAFDDYQWNELLAEQRIQQLQNEMFRKQSKEEEERQKRIDKELKEHLRQQEERRYYTQQWVLKQWQDQQNEPLCQETPEDVVESEQVPQCQFEFENDNYPEEQNLLTQSPGTVVNDDFVQEDNVSCQMQMEIIQKIHKNNRTSSSVKSKYHYKKIGTLCNDMF